MKIDKIASEILEKRRIYDEISLKKRKERIYEKCPQIKSIDRQIKEAGNLAVKNAWKGLSTKELEDKIKILGQTRKRLLKENGFKEDDLDMKYHCDICQDTGFIRGKSCSCRNQIIIEERYRRSNIDMAMKKENFSTFNLNLYSKNPEDSFGMSPYENMENILAFIKIYLRDFSKTSSNLYIFGEVGRGKTFLLNCIAKNLLDRNFSVLYQPATSLFSFMNDYLYAFSERKEILQDKYDLIFNSDLLIIDDLGSESFRESNSSNLFDIVNDRMINNKPVIFSSNYDIDLVKEIYGDRNFSRILGSSKILEIIGNDLRIGEGIWRSITIYQ